MIYFWEKIIFVFVSKVCQWCTLHSKLYWTKRCNESNIILNSWIFSLFLSTSLLGASRSYFFPPSFPNPPWSFLLFYINYTKYFEIQNNFSISLSLSLSLSFSLSFLPWNLLIFYMDWNKYIEIYLKKV